MSTTQISYSKNTNCVSPKKYNKLRLCLLFQNEHLPRSGEFSGCKHVEIDTTRYLLTYLISAIPIRCTVFALIHSRRLVSEYQCPNQSAI